MKIEGNFCEHCIANRIRVIQEVEHFPVKKTHVHCILAPLATLSTILFHVEVLNIQEIAAVNGATLCRAK